MPAAASHGRSAGSRGRAKPTMSQRSARLQEPVHPRQRGRRVHVVQGRHRGDHAERAGCEGVGEEVAADQVELSGRVLAPGQIDAVCIGVDAGHVRDQVRQLPASMPSTTANIEYAVVEADGLAGSEHVPSAKLALRL